MKQIDDKEYTDRMQFQYDVTNEKTLTFQALLEKIGDRHFHAALDVGCGPGDVTKALSLMSDELTLVDITPGYRDVLQKKFPNAAVIIDDFHHLSFKKKFDAVLFSHGYYYIPEKDWMTSTEKLISFVKPGGSLFLILLSDDNDLMKFVNWFWDQYPETKLFHYQPFLNFIQNLKQYGNITTRKIDCSHEFMSDQTIEIAGMSLLAIPRELITLHLYPSRISFRG